MSEAVHPCPVCGRSDMEAGDFIICEICSWENDPVQLKEADLAGGANGLSLGEARAYWQASGEPVPVRGEPTERARAFLRDKGAMQS